MSKPEDLDALRVEMEQINTELLKLFNRRAALVERIFDVKERDDMPLLAPEREMEMLESLIERNPGPFSDDTVRHLFKELLAASRELMEVRPDKVLKISRLRKKTDLMFQVGGHTVGAEPILIAGPCSVESEEQMETVASHLAACGVKFLRGGAFKPRSSPYSFQGLGARGLQIMADAARRHGMVTVSEVLDPRAVELVAEKIDILQIGARNMYNYELLREVGMCGKPVLLKRALSATLDELLWAAEYIIAEGNERIIFCERGIRTFEAQTRFTLDISAVPLLRQHSYLPVIVDVSHAAGRRDILAALGRAALAAGADGLMVEVHPHPHSARSDGQQQLDLKRFSRFLEQIGMNTEPGNQD